MADQSLPAPPAPPEAVEGLAPTNIQASESELGWIPAKIPTRGELNLHPDTGESLIPNGEIMLRKLKGREESILLSQGAEGLERMDIILKQSTKLPNGVKPLDLLITDRMALLLALRTIVFGPHYSFNYKCMYCNGMTRTDVNITEDLEEHTPETNAFNLLKEEKIQHEDEYQLKEPFELDLPDCGDTVEVRFLRGTDEKNIATRSKRMAMQSNDPSDPSYLYRIALQIVTIQGEKHPLAKREIYVRELTMLDLAHIRIEVDKVEPGIDMRLYPSCTQCGAINEISMPFTVEFFRPAAL